MSVITRLQTTGFPYPGQFLQTLSQMTVGDKDQDSVKLSKHSDEMLQPAEGGLQQIHTNGFGTWRNIYRSPWLIDCVTSSAII